GAADFLAAPAGLVRGLRDHEAGGNAGLRLHRLGRGVVHLDEVAGALARDARLRRRRGGGTLAWLRRQVRRREAGGDAELTLELLGDHVGEGAGQAGDLVGELLVEPLGAVLAGFVVWRAACSRGGTLAPH